MSQLKLTLRPPPNVDFVQGYPGIPPSGADRPQAAVKGAIEVRAGPQGVKAKWVRIELRKIETLPGGGVANTFFDFVGQSPINLWQSPNDEFSPLTTNDFPFFIRIPESVPPTLSLDKGAGIKYELIASVCIQGKKGFLRREKPTISATASPIIVDKHELHSTWPIYTNPETRTHSQDGVTLIVDRSHTCYGPGDRVTVMATIKSDTLHTVMLRGLEFALRETTVFRAGPHLQGKKGAPQIRVTNIGEQKVPMNQTLYGGTQHKAELTVTIPHNHTSATITAARHIDITYTLSVKAMMSAGQPIVLDLPIVVSNWPRNVSQEAMKRIGLAFNVSAPGHSPAQHAATSLQSPAIKPTYGGQSNGSSSFVTQPAGGSARTGSSHNYSNSQSTTSPNDPYAADSVPATKHPIGQYVTAPAERNAYGGRTDEFGLIDNKSASSVGGGARTTGNRSGSTTSHDSPANFARPQSAGRGNPANRLTIANIGEEDLSQLPTAVATKPVADVRQTPLSSGSGSGSAAPSGSGSGSGAGSSSQPRKWASAEEEKEKLYRQAVAQVERVHGRPISPSLDSATPAITPMVDVGSPRETDAGTAAQSGSGRKWLTAEEEKARLFAQASAAVLRVQGQAPPPPSSSGATLYQNAMSEIGKPISQSPPPMGNGRSPASTKPMASAADEKAVLQRYYAAQNAVVQNHTEHYGTVPEGADPTIPLTPYSAMMSPPVAGPMPVSPPIPNGPPAFPTSPSPMDALTAISEKERMRRFYEAQDAAAAQHSPPPSLPYSPPPPPQSYYEPKPPPAPLNLASPVSSAARLSAFGAPPPTSTFGTPPPPFTPPPMSTQPLDAFSEKEMLRRRYEQQDAAAGVQSPGVPTPPPRSSGLPLLPNGTRGRPPPTPPISPNPPMGRPLTALEEKARLKALYEAEEHPPPPMHPYPTPPPSDERQATPPRASQMFATPPPPPPLAPKPPKEYIQETQEEDLRTHATLRAIDERDPTVLATLKADIPESEFDDSADIPIIPNGTADPRASMLPQTPPQSYSPPSSLASPFPAPGPPPPLPPLPQPPVTE